MKKLFAVTRVRGRAWDSTKPMRAQTGWAEHAMFMDDLATNRFVMLGGPIGDETKTLLIVDAADEGEIDRTFVGDPWSKSGHLEMESIQLWTVLLQAGPVIHAMPSPRKNLDARAS